MAVEKIISGGQIGADIAGLRAGVRIGIQTGGWMPHGFHTRDGLHPEYASLFGCSEHECSGYPPRTRQNVLESDATVRFAVNFSSLGEICTLNAINAYSKPFFDVPIRDGQTRIGYLAGAHFRRFLFDHDVRVLNVAGNALSWLEPVVESFLVSHIARYNASEMILPSREVRESDTPF